MTYSTDPDFYARNPNQLARFILDWHDAQASADAMRDVIEATILKMQETVNVGDLRFSYYGERSQFESYEDCAKRSLTEEELSELEKEHSETVVKVDYKAICKDQNLGRLLLDETRPERVVFRQIII